MVLVIEYEALNFKELMEDLSYNQLHVLCLFTETEKEFYLDDSDKYHQVNYFKKIIEQEKLEKHERCTLMYNLINEFKEYSIRKGFILYSCDLYVIIDNHIMEFNNNELLEIMWNSITENKTISEYILDII